MSTFIMQIPIKGYSSFQNKAVCFHQPLKENWKAIFWSMIFYGMVFSWKLRHFPIHTIMISKSSQSSYKVSGGEKGKNSQTQRYRRTSHNRLVRARLYSEGIALWKNRWEVCASHKGTLFHTLQKMNDFEVTSILLQGFLTNK